MQLRATGAGKTGISITERVPIDPAFEDLLTAAAPRVQTFLARLAGHLADADDAWQECCARAWRSRATFDPDRGTFDSWIMRIAFTSYLDQRDAAKRAPVSLGDDDGRLIASKLVHVDPSLVDELEARLAELPNMQRDIVLRFHRDGQSIAEIAHTIGLKIGTVKSHLHRARVRLRARRWED
ncbi:MAG: RNA polymerase sigma factor [Planctomycetes bacterium]|nr:RNA polymerase sigma factor [Planctomycetota bacterium]